MKVTILNQQINKTFTKHSDGGAAYYTEDLPTKIKNHRLFPTEIEKASSG